MARIPISSSTKCAVRLGGLLALLMLAATIAAASWSSTPPPPARCVETALPPARSRWHQVGDPVPKYIWVISSGHVGTSKLKTMCSPPNICEQEIEWGGSANFSYYNCPSYYNAQHADFQTAYAWSLARMQSQYVPAVKQRGGRDGAHFLHLGHQLICGWGWFALCEVVRDMMFVKIDRDEVWNAVSLCAVGMRYKKPPSLFAVDSDVVLKLGWGLYMTNDSVLWLPIHEYQRLSCFQKGLWEVRELNARYEYAIERKCPNVPLLEVRWADGNFTDMLDVLQGHLSGILEVSVGDAVEKERQHTRDDVREYVKQNPDLVRAQQDELSQLIERHFVPLDQRPGWE